MKLLSVILAIFFWGVFFYVTFFLDYPESFTAASPFQLLAFFIPLFLAFNFSLVIPLKNYFYSTTISVGLVIFLILQALDFLNVFSGVSLIVAIGLLLSYFKNLPAAKNLTSGINVPKLSKLRRGRV